MSIINRGKRNSGFKLDLFLQILRNVELTPTIVMLTLTAPTLKARSTARVIRDTLEMESRVLVCGIYFIVD